MPYSRYDENRPDNAFPHELDIEINHEGVPLRDAVANVKYRVSLTAYDDGGAVEYSIDDVKILQMSVYENGGERFGAEDPADTMDDLNKIMNFSDEELVDEPEGEPLQPTKEDVIEAIDYLHNTLDNDVYEEADRVLENMLQ